MLSIAQECISSECLNIHFTLQDDEGTNLLVVLNMGGANLLVVLNMGGANLLVILNMGGANL